MSNPQTKDAKEKKVRVFNLAKELNVESKLLLDFCKELGFAEITNQLSGLVPDQADALKERVKKGPAKSGAAHPTGGAHPKSVIPPPAKLDKPIQTLSKPTPKPAPKPVEPVAVVPAPVAATEPLAPAPTAEAPAEPIAVVTAPVAAPRPPAPVVPPKNFIPAVGAGGMRNLSTGRPAPARPAAPPTPAAPVPVAATPAPVAPPAEVTPVVPEAPIPAAPPPAVAAQAPPVAPAKPPAAPLAPPGPPKNIIPSLAGTSGRPDILKRAPQVQPPTIIAGRRTGTGAPPPGGQRPPSGASGPPGQRPGGPGGGPRPGGPPGSAPARPPLGGAPAKPGGTGQSVKLTPEMIDRLRLASARGQRMSIGEISRPVPGAPPGQPAKPGAPAGPGGPPRPGVPALRGPGEPVAPGEDEDEKKKAGVIGRDARQRGRTGGGAGRGGSGGGPRVDRGSVVIGSDGVHMVEQQWGSRRGPRQALLRKALRGKIAPIIKEGKIEIGLPITVRSLSDAIGMKVVELSKRLMKETNQLYGNNSPVDFDTAALIAVEKNIELVIKRQKSAEEILIEEFEGLVTNVDPEKLRPRPPVVTIMGHVDHGKTSLLDKIRRSNVAAGEVGGITQVIRAWSVMHRIDDPTTGEKVIEKPITFLDTPGHEAFTKMRARGANVTDIAVIVVAATDGVMPQTEEAVAHARAADVRIIVAINKVDAPNANVDRTRRQLYNLELLPDNMGGDVQFVETSALTGQGIDELLSAILIEAELNLAEDLQADPDRPAFGTCLEGYMTGDEGVMATVLVHQGTLKLGDIVLCGANYGRVRSMQNDMGASIEEAGPSTPVLITGLGGVPNADDPFYVVDELTTAAKIAAAREKKERDEKLNKFTTVTLENFAATKDRQKITELKIILKAEARGSIEAIKKELEKLTHAEVTTRVLHAGIGAITESDVQLALTSPDDTLVIGFNVTADDAALKLAEGRDISLREYQIIYNLVDDVRAALEGRLKPIEEVVHLGRAVVRQTFKHGKVGTIAGCYVTSGVLERSARVRVIRNGVVVFPPADKVVGLDSLKRFKDDAKDVREGFECGLKITDFNDIKVDDVIEAFKIEIRARTL